MITPEEVLTELRDLIQWASAKLEKAKKSEAAGRRSLALWTGRERDLTMTAETYKEFKEGK